MKKICFIPLSNAIKALRMLEKSHFTQRSWPVKMSKPCSQINSKVIRDKAECHIVAAIEKICSLVAFKWVCMMKLNKPRTGSAKSGMNAI